MRFYEVLDQVVALLRQRSREAKALLEELA
jgi:hypothetical protein